MANDEERGSSFIEVRKKANALFACALYIDLALVDSLY